MRSDWAVTQQKSIQQNKHANEDEAFQRDLSG